MAMAVPTSFITKMTGRLTDRRLVTSVYLNRTGNLPAQPDVHIEHDGLTTALLAKDVNGDDKRDLLFPLVKIGVRNLIRNLLTDRADVALGSAFLSRSGDLQPRS